MSIFNKDFNKSLGLVLSKTPDSDIPKIANDIVLRDKDGLHLFLRVNGS